MKKKEDRERGRHDIPAPEFERSEKEREARRGVLGPLLFRTMGYDESAYVPEFDLEGTRVR